MNICEHAEAYRLLLMMGLASKGEVISWADEIIATRADPPAWVLDVSLAANGNNEMVESKLRDLPCDGDRARAAYFAIERFAAAFGSGKIPAVSAARMLELWAANANVIDDHRTKAMTPSWIADEIVHRFASEQDVLASVEAFLKHFATVRATENRG